MLFLRWTGMGTERSTTGRSYSGILRRRRRQQAKTDTRRWWCSTIRETAGTRTAGLIAADAIYSSLRLWVDRNYNGVSEPEELIGPAAAGVFSTDLHYIEDRYSDSYRNWFHCRAKVWDAAGHAANKCYDVFLQLRPVGGAN